MILRKDLLLFTSALLSTLCLGAARADELGPRRSDLCLRMLVSMEEFGHPAAGPRNIANSLYVPIVSTEPHVRELLRRYSRLQRWGVRLRAGKHFRGGPDYEMPLILPTDDPQLAAQIVLARLKYLDEARLRVRPTREIMPYVIRGYAQVREYLDMVLATTGSRSILDDPSASAAPILEYVRQLRGLVDTAEPGLNLRMHAFTVALPLVHPGRTSPPILSAPSLREGIDDDGDETREDARRLTMHQVLFHDGREWALHVVAEEVHYNPPMRIIDWH